MDMNTGKKLGISLAVLTMALAGCATPTQKGALGGGALGAGLGAVIGHQSGHGAEGAAIGAAAGALTGALVGDKVQKDRNAAAQPRPQEGHYETRIVHGPRGERYEERVWVPHR